MNTETTTTNSKLVITRFDIFERNDDDGERRVFRLFAKRKLVGEVDIEDTRSDAEEVLPDFLTSGERRFPDTLDFLDPDMEGQEAEDEDGEGGGSVVPEKYRVKYGVTQRCGDTIAETLSAYVTLPRAGKKDIDGGLDRAKLQEVAAQNGLAAKLEGYEDRGLNGGLLRMNISNILRGMNRRGERVQIGTTDFPAREVEKVKRQRKAKATGDILGIKAAFASKGIGKATKA